MNKNEHLNDFDETLRSSMKKTTSETFDFDYSRLDQPVNKKKPLYLIPISTGVVAAILCTSIALGSAFRNIPPALITMDNPSSVDLQASQNETPLTTISTESNNKATNSSKMQAASRTKESTPSSPIIVKNITIPKWYSPGTLKVTTLLSTHKENNTGYSVRFIYTNSLYGQPGHEGCNAPRFDIVTGEFICTNHEIYNAIKGKLPDFNSPQSINVYQSSSNDKYATFTNGIEKSQGEGLAWPDFYIYSFDSKTAIKAPFPPVMGSYTFSRDGTKALILGRDQIDPFIFAYHDLYIFDLKIGSSQKINADEKGNNTFYPYIEGVPQFSPDGRYTLCHTKWGAGKPTGSRLERSYAIYDTKTKNTVIRNGFGTFSGNSTYYLHIDGNTLRRYQLESGKTENVGTIPASENYELFSAGYDGRLLALTIDTQDLWVQNFKIIKDGTEIRQLSNVKAAVTDQQNKYFYWYEGTNDYISVMSMETGETFEIPLPEDGYHEMTTRIKRAAFMSLYVSIDGKNIALEYSGA